MIGAASAEFLIRHEIDPALVADSVERNILSNEERREQCRVQADAALRRYEAADEKARERYPRRPEGSGYVDPMIDEWNARERDLYSTVFVGERTDLESGENRFFLFYGNDLTEGTGGFESFEKAQGWFLKQGR